MEGLQRLAKSVLSPLLLTNTSWPDTIRKDLATSVHKFLGSLVQNVHAKKGNTVLYIPSLDLTIAPAVAAMNKELLQLMETCVIHATRQVKDVLNKQGHQAAGDETGPLQEIAFWRARSDDLCHIRDQLDGPECVHIVQVRCCFILLCFYK